jgi:hypothetical protein
MPAVSQVLNLANPTSVFQDFIDVNSPDEPPLIAMPAVSQDSAYKDNTLPSHDRETFDPLSEGFFARDVLPDATQGTNFSLSPPSNPVASLVMEGDIWDDVHEFFDTLYMVFPIVSYEDLTMRLMTEPDWTAVPDLQVLLLAIRLLNAAGRHRMCGKDKTVLSNLIYQVEAARLHHDFAEDVNLDAVVCSLCLFTACNVLEKHNRAFLYLDEAMSLFEMVPSCVGSEELRRLRIEQVLFNTEAATHAIYAPRTRKLRARTPLIGIDQAAAALTPHADSDGIATHLLKCLTQINLARDARGLEEINKRSESDVETLFGAGIKHHRYSRIQAADVVITRQWRLSSRLLEHKMSGAGASISSDESAADRLGIPAMSWICLLRDGELRVVGLGKLMGLLQNICMLTRKESSRYVLAGLTSAITREDHDQAFAPALGQMIAMMTSAIPPALDVHRTHWSIATEDEAEVLDHPVSTCSGSELQLSQTRFVDGLDDHLQSLLPGSTAGILDNLHWLSDIT